MRVSIHSTLDSNSRLRSAVNLWYDDTMALYLDQCTNTGHGNERENLVVCKRFRLVDGTFGGIWPLDDAIRESRKDVFRDKSDRLFSLRVLSSPEEL